MSNLKCTIQLVFCAIIEQNGRWRIDDFLFTAQHQHHTGTGLEIVGPGQEDPEHHIKISKNGYTLMRSFNALLARSTVMTPGLASIRTSRTAGTTVPLAE
ncbi:hypothetical protein [Pseudomonas sp. R37(2017)]|uniref:hypothetical protein n=1 Tax=Pseudomonas sp. R37(2017) TaxID=1981685 RepID=UPI001179E365|nr:hypothetical protein [Pseudomonas sp. R37(2017)]